ncbi:sensor histidine kinase [Portibacter lacus]|nr:HAMP domain-containing sensor histidine kinase [Portibacter lacus]
MGLLISQLWRQGRKKIRIFSMLIIGYMLAALAWWAILLHKQALIIHDLRLESGIEIPESAKELNRQRWMIGSEALFFGAILIFGIILLNRAFRAEIFAARQQKNFLLSVTHELKSPITAIQLILDTFKRRKLNESQALELITNGQEEAFRLNKLVEDLLTAARLNPKKNLDRENVDILKAINPIIAQYQKNYPHFQFTVPPYVNTFICHTNEPSLCLIVSNLLDNAVKYSPVNKEIKVEILKKNSSVYLRVLDAGIGIIDDEKLRVFDQFYRIGDEHIRTTKGTGLGLFLVKELCTKLNIKVFVRDNEPEGSIFELVIPTK